MTTRPAALLVATLALAGCGGDDGGGAETDGGTTETSAVTTTTVDPDVEVEAAATVFTTALFEWDGETIEEDFDAILDFAAGDFEAEARATFADEATRQALRENRASERMTDLEVHIESIDGDDARVFVTAEILAASVQIPDPRADTIRAEIGLTRIDGEWKVYDLNLLDGLSLGLPDEPAG